jgi:hypothetical protein
MLRRFTHAMSTHAAGISAAARRQALSLIAFGSFTIAGFQHGTTTGFVVLGASALVYEALQDSESTP